MAGNVHEGYSKAWAQLCVNAFVSLTVDGTGSAPGLLYIAPSVTVLLIKR